MCTITCCPCLVVYSRAAARSTWQAQTSAWRTSCSSPIWHSLSDSAWDLTTASPTWRRTMIMCPSVHLSRRPGLLTGRPTLVEVMYLVGYSIVCVVCMQGGGGGSSEPISRLYTQPWALWQKVALGFVSYWMNIIIIITHKYLRIRWPMFTSLYVWVTQRWGPPVYTYTREYSLKGVCLGDTEVGSTSVHIYTWVQLEGCKLDHLMSWS